MARDATDKGKQPAGPQYDGGVLLETIEEKGSPTRRSPEPDPEPDPDHSFHEPEPERPPPRQRRKCISMRESLSATVEAEDPLPALPERPAKFGNNGESVKYLENATDRAFRQSQHVATRLEEMAKVIDENFAVHGDSLTYVKDQIVTMNASISTLSDAVTRIERYIVNGDTPKVTRPSKPAMPFPSMSGGLPKPTQEWTSYQFNQANMQGNNATRYQYGIDSDDLIEIERPRDRDQNRFPPRQTDRDRGFHTDRGFRNQTEDRATVHTMGSGASSQPRIKREDVGQFDPHYYDPDDVGIVCEGRNMIFTDIFCFGDRLRSFLEDEDTALSAEKQILAMFQTLLSGPAVIWWNNELTEQMRIQLRKKGLEAVMGALRTRFAHDAATATNKFTESKLTLKDIAESDTALLQFIQRKLRYAHAIGILNNKNTNWYGTMVQIWSSLDLKIKQYLRAPRTSEALSDYMQEVEESKAILLVAATERYPHVVSNRVTVQSRKKDRSPERRSARYDNRDNGNYRRDDRRRDDRRNDGRRGDRRDDRRRDDRRRDDYKRDEKRDDAKKDQGNSYRGRDDHRDRRDRDYRRDDRRDRYDKDGKKKDQVHFAGSEGDEAGSDRSASSAPHSSGEDSAFMALAILDRHLTCHKCHAEFLTVAKARSHTKECSPFKATMREGMRTPSPNDPSKRTCGYCRELLPSRNELFRHLKACEDAKKGFIRPVTEAEPEPVHLVNDKPAEAVRMIEAPSDLVREADSNPLSSYTHLRVKMKTSPAADEREICFDPGAGKSYIDKKLLANMPNHRIEKRAGGARGLHKAHVKLSEWAEFDFYLPGKDDQGRATLARFTKSAWVVDDLPAGALLGNDFLNPFQCNIDYGTNLVTFGKMDGFCVDFDVEAKSRSCVRKVKTQRKVVLLPGESVYIPVDYKPVPNDRSFSFKAKHGAVANAVMNAKSPRVVMAVNNTDGTLTIPKNTFIGHIEEITDSGYFVTSWTKGMKLMALELAIAALPQGAEAQTAVAQANLGSDLSRATVNSEFSVAGLADLVDGGNDVPIIATQHTAAAKPSDKPSSTPLSDQVFGTTPANLPIDNCVINTQRYPGRLPDFDKIFAVTSNPTDDGDYLDDRKLRHARALMDDYWGRNGGKPQEVPEEAAPKAQRKAKKEEGAGTRRSQKLKK